MSGWNLASFLLLGRAAEVRDRRSWPRSLRLIKVPRRLLFAAPPWAGRFRETDRLHVFIADVYTWVYLSNGVSGVAIMRDFIDLGRPGHRGSADLLAGLAVRRKYNSMGDSICAPESMGAEAP